MKELAEKLRGIETEISLEKGDLLLFSLVLRDRSQDRWDLLISASWIPAKKRGTLDYIAGKLKGKLNTRELQRISRIVILEPDDPFVTNMQSAIQVEHGMTEWIDCTINNVRIDQAYVITARREPVPK